MADCRVGLSHVVPTGGDLFPKAPAPLREVQVLLGVRPARVYNGAFTRNAGSSRSAEPKKTPKLDDAYGNASETIITRLKVRLVRNGGSGF